MRLRSLCIRHFRGVAEARLELDPAITVLVGENDFGKTSLLEALFMALGGGEPDQPIVFGAPHLFHVGRTSDSPVAGPPSIELVFEEKHADEEGPGSPLAHVLGPRRDAPRALRLAAEGVLEGEALHTTFTIEGLDEGGRAVRDDHALLASLRRLHPLLWLRGGMLVGTDLLAGPTTDQGARAHAALAPEIEALARDLEGRYQRVVTGQSLHTARDISTGAAAAESLLKLREETESVSSISEGPVFAEIVGRRTLPSRQAVQRRRSRLGSAAQRIGVLMLVAAVMRSGRGAFAPDVDPIVAIEDPEAHLHPMTLATIWDLLQQIGWQKLVTTHSGTLLSSAPLASLRRLVRSSDGALAVRSVRPEQLGRDVLRKFSYHVRMRRGAAMFARAWLLVEGETEFWVLSEIARLVGFDLQQEGVAVVEFAQSGLAPLVKVADALGIGWHLLADGDRAGVTYANKARGLAGDRDPGTLVTCLRERDIEHCFFEHGHRTTFLDVARLDGDTARELTPTRIIQKAIRASSKPGLAFALLEAAGSESGPGVPKPLRQVIERVLALAWRAHAPA
ncbi:MAG: DUF2813 domain-containing protein [Sandaracinaceae bacterium]|nr:DUF2813 domain-containing protein [Sandaracinaceae bacterium]